MRLDQAAIWLLCVIASCDALRAQCTGTPSVIARVEKTFGGTPPIKTAVRQPVSSDSRFAIDINMSGKVKTAPDASEFTLTLDPGGVQDSSKVISRVLTGAGQQAGRITLRLKPLTGFDPETTTKLTIKHQGIQLECGEQPLDVTTDLVVTVKDFEREFERVKTELEKAQAVETPQDQRHIYAAVMAVKGEGGNTEGTGDVVINQQFYEAKEKVGVLFDSADVKLIVKKNSGTNADPRNLTTGVEMTKALLWGGARRARITAAGLPTSTGDPSKFIVPDANAAASKGTMGRTELDNLVRGSG